jgi:paraquat-inducible protein A
VGFQATAPLQSQTRVCQHCELAVEWSSLPDQESAYCPRCNTQLYRGKSINVSGNLPLALACVVLFYPALFEPFLSIRLIGEWITASLWDGVVALYNDGFNSLAIFVGLTTIVTPAVVLIAAILAQWSIYTQNQRWLKRCLNAIQWFKHWMMLDVFLISIAISAFKLQDYSDLHFRHGLLFLALLQVLILLLITRLSSRRYWEVFETYPSPIQPSPHPHSAASSKIDNDLDASVNDESGAVESTLLVDCPHCHLTQTSHGRCERCNTRIKPKDDYKMVRNTWAFLLIATIAIIPANLVPISILITNGQRLQDTILSGIGSLVENGMPGIALIIFVASIIVPVFKIIGIAYILLTIQLDQQHSHRQRMTVYFIVKWIGKWSMMDILVIAIMLTLVDRGQILNFTPGYGAIAFAVVVFFTMLATESLKPNLIWRNINNKVL